MLKINSIYFSLANKVCQGHQNRINKLVSRFKTFYSPHCFFFYTYILSVTLFLIFDFFAYTHTMHHIRATTILRMLNIIFACNFNDFIYIPHSLCMLFCFQKSYALISNGTLFYCVYSVCIGLTSALYIFHSLTKHIRLIKTT
jgi:hypothetical protein